MHRSDIPDIRAKELLTVVTLAEYGSFVAAAAHLKTSQPALTRTVKRVERVLGVTLFARNTRRVEITPAGREFVAVAERVLDDLQLTVRNLDEVTREQRGRVTVSTYSAFAVNPMPFLVRDYRETRPLIEVRIREGRQFDILEDVRSGAADFGIGYVNSLPDLMDSTMLRSVWKHSGTNCIQPMRSCSSVPTQSTALVGKPWPDRSATSAPRTPASYLPRAIPRWATRTTGCAR